jgi:hypothetical protein
MSAPLDHRDWFERTGSCGGCGQPGTWCQCAERRPCRCRDLHVMGSGIGVDPLDVFAAGGPVPVSDEQGELFA